MKYHSASLPSPAKCITQIPDLPLPLMLQDPVNPNKNSSCGWRTSWAWLLSPVSRTQNPPGTAVCQATAVTGHRQRSIGSGERGTGSGAPAMGPCKRGMFGFDVSPDEWNYILSMRATWRRQTLKDLLRVVYSSSLSIASICAPKLQPSCRFSGGT